VSAFNMRADGFEFEVPGDVVPKERPRVGRYSTRTPTRTATYETLVGMHTMLAVATWARAYRRAWDTSARYSVAIRIHRSSRHRFDIDNAAKSILDGAIGGLWADDSQVDDLHIRRAEVSPDSPRTIVTVRRIGETVIGRAKPSSPPGARKRPAASRMR
jgi:Holliday junction resolvase RusA-like endonuclease